MMADQATPRGKRCPICGKPAVTAFRPFCSDRCKDIDLHRWLAGAYAIPAASDDEDEDGKSSGG
ncbi:hypothetical protein X566_05605 [Afipia sp. P52-10]|uniref:DNA gyrase inhibitor YacG n=1 Tax=Afipia sp. P52-10 TaxID=1429916 RepID=UPI0003DF1803|nr:DNA gyrase inhibitor YacG [Afipia sp. P52-10]ETR77153.1 hypothetical protein X566_05605 [Afipia sp. P52-10]